MKISLPKLKALLLYFGNNTNPRFLGKVKLMKLFYFLDFIHLKKFGSPVTYDCYVHLEHGPIPQSIKNLIDTASDEIDRSILADVIYFERPSRTGIVKMVPRRKFTDNDRQYLSETEIEALDIVCKKYGDMNTGSIEDASHKEAPWRETELLDSIPYSLAAKDPDCLVSKKEIELLGRVLQND